MRKGAAALRKGATRKEAVMVRFEGHKRGGSKDEVSRRIMMNEEGYRKTWAGGGWEKRMIPLATYMDTVKC